MWHRKIITDLKLTRAAVCFAGLILDDWDMNHHGYASLSLRKAARELHLDKSTVLRARNLLEERGWLVRLPSDRGTRKRAVYKLGDGPECISNIAPKDSLSRPPLSFSLGRGCTDALTTGCTHATSTGCTDATSGDDDYSDHFTLSRR